MNDRELLELAAKAAGNVPDGFSPLTDDGDAFRLAVTLGLCVMFHATQVEYSKGAGKVGVVAEQTFRDAATARRAIVRAAAEIGRNKA